MANEFITNEDNKVLVNVSFLEVYIPKYFEERKYLQFDNNMIEIFGLVNMRILKDEEEDRNSVKLNTLKFPSKFKTIPFEYEYQTISLLPDSIEDKYLVLRYRKGDVFMTSRTIVKDIENVEIMWNLLTDGKIPTTIPYDDILDLYLLNSSMNDVRLNVPATLISAMIAESYRLKSDNSIQLRKVLGKDPTNKKLQLDYSQLNTRQICAQNSSLAAMTFEDPTNMLLNSIVRKRLGKPEMETPMEKIIDV